MKIEVDKGYVEYIKHDGDEEIISKIAGISHESEQGPGIEKLLVWNHLSPFEFASITFKVKCPIFVARQLFRHRTGAYMEKSLRYCEGNPEFYIPNQDADLYERAYDSAWQYYNWLLLNQTDKEVARSVLPIGIYTEYYFQMNIRNLIHMLSLRMESSAQKETQAIARAMHMILTDYFPTVAKYVLTLV